LIEVEGTKVNALEYVNTSVRVIIDRPIGSVHPTHGFAYRVNYGYVPGTTSGDGEELDAYVLGVTEPLSEFDGECIAVVQRADDDDDKLVLVRPGTCLSDEQIMELVSFQERFFASRVVR
jgi:inorganic pyrophosphatase